MKVLFVTSELAPYVKTGGLADVSAALPRALRRIGIDVCLLVPGYLPVLDGVRHLREVAVLDATAHFPRCQLLIGSAGDDLPVVVAQCLPLYERGGTPYQDGYGQDWPDNPQRFALLSKVAALIGSEMSPLEWRADIVHGNDWQGGLAPAYLRLLPGPTAQRAASVFTVHNLAYQGNFDPSLVSALGLPPSCYDINGVEFHGRFSFLKAGLFYAERITTVSPTYAREIQSEASGFGLHGLIAGKAAQLTGILNGIDEASWNPAHDPYLPVHYGPERLERKGLLKMALQRRMGLAIEPSIPLFGVVGRLAHQKGIDLVLEAIPDLTALPAQLVVLGSGDAALEDGLARAARENPGRVATALRLEEELSHWIEAASDFFLMPSRYEPCGLNQMYSQRYGTPPVVHATGGLADTVRDNETGLLFAPHSLAAFRGAIARAARLYRDAAAYRAMQRRGMEADFGWARSAWRYAALYRGLAAASGPAPSEPSAALLGPAPAPAAAADTRPRPPRRRRRS